MVILAFLAMRYNEKHGHWPLMKSKKISKQDDSISESELSVYEKKNVKAEVQEVDGSSSNGDRALSV